MSDVTSNAQQEEYVKTHAFGHHAACTCSIGADEDTKAVLDSELCVRGVEN